MDNLKKDFNTLFSREKKKEKTEVVFQGSFESCWDNRYLYKNYGQETKIDKIGEDKFTIGEIIDSEKNIKFIADYMNKGKSLALDSASELDWHMANLIGTSFAYDKNWSDYGINVIYNWEFDRDEETEDGDIYETWYGKSKEIIEKKVFAKMPEKDLIAYNAENMVKYLNQRAKDMHIDNIDIEKYPEGEE